MSLGWKSLKNVCLILIFISINLKIIEIKKHVPDTPIPLPSNQLLDIIHNLASYKSQNAPHLVESMKSNTLLAFGIAVQEYMIYLMEPLVKDTIKMNLIEAKKQNKERKDKSTKE